MNKIRIYKRMRKAEKNIEDIWQEKEDLAIKLIELNDQIQKIKEQIRKIGIVNDALGVLEKQIKNAIQTKERDQEEADNNQN